MNNIWYLYFIILVLFLVVLWPKKRRRKIAASKIVKKQMEGNEKMKELAQRFIGKDVYVKLIDGAADGVLQEVTDNGLVLESKDKLQVVNLSYVLTIRQYPYNKKGKRATVFD